ncbi:MAG: putative toxin-antitoxin system toxin component, PIN family [Nanoarchaeota archaeon]
MIKVVLDTNTHISALGWKDGNPRKVLELCVIGKCRLIESIGLIKEFVSVISRPKFNFITEEEKNQFLVFLLQISNLIEPKEKINAIKEDPDDNTILETALAGKVDYVVSGDRHLLKLKQFRGIRIVTAKEFLNLIK